MQTRKILKNGLYLHSLNIITHQRIRELRESIILCPNSRSPPHQPFVILVLLAPDPPISPRLDPLEHRVMMSTVLPGLRAQRVTLKWKSLQVSACNLQESLSLFRILLTGPIFASGKVLIPKTMELIIDNCQLSKKQHQLESNCGPQSRAQHQTLRGRKHIYKIMLTTYSA